MYIFYGSRMVFYYSIDFSITLEIEHELVSSNLEQLVLIGTFDTDLL